MKKKMSYILYIVLVLSAIHWLMREKNGADTKGRALSSHKAFWKKDKFFIPKSAISENFNEQFTAGENVFVFQSFENEECFLGSFVFVGFQKNIIVLKGNKSINASKIDKHFSVKNQKIDFKILHSQDHTYSNFFSCKEWVTRGNF